MRYSYFVIGLITAGLMTACATKPPRVAQKKTVTVAGQKLEFGGEYDERNTALSITVNSERLMSGTFSSYNATLQLKSPYKGMEVSADCYFGSILGNRRGVFGIVAGAVQAGNGKSGDTCDVLVDGKVLEKLYF
jgi:hypothetical protein